ncbi:MAG: NAD-dependent epimerase/dehydratase family protein [Candidatus Kapaibacterium sp.]
MKYTLITGANGEIGHSLVERLHQRGDNIIAVDLQPLDETVAAKCAITYSGDLGNITNEQLYTELEKLDITEIYHLAALLSTSAEKNPGLAQHVNVGGTIRLLELARTTGKRIHTAVKFLFPSTIAIYGFTSVEAKKSAGKVKEDEHTLAHTVYGINKYYCEQLGRYYDRHFMQLSAEKENGYVDFRGVRYPGLISAFTVPTGGTSDYAPEMLHAAAQGKAYSCFVREDARIPFMAMPDGVDAIVQLAEAPKEHLTRNIYNIAAFAPTAKEIADKVRELYPDCDIQFKPDIKRQGIVDTWCEDVDDSTARADWNWQASFDFERTFKEYLAPNIKQRYS